MPLSLPPLDFAIICNDSELETHNVTQDGPNAMRAYIASEAGKQFRFSFSNNLLDFNLALHFYIDGQCVSKCHIGAGQRGEVSGITKTTSSILPFKFQDLQLVDPDAENAPVVAGMGMIELLAYRSREVMRTVPCQPKATNGLHQGRVSERSKMAGWHHVSTADEVPCISQTYAVLIDYLDPLNAPLASFRIFYRPRELLMAEGVIKGYGVDAGIGGGGSDANDRKRARGNHCSPGPSIKRRTGSTVKKEEMSADARAQRIRALQAELDSLTAEQSGSSSVKRELKSPSPTVIDLTLDD